MVEPGFYLGDCMFFLKDMPDKCIDLAIVDPPYGDALQNGGGYYNRFGERFDRYKGGVARKTEVPPRCTISGRTAASQTGHGVTRTGGTWATKYSKKL